MEKVRRRLFFTVLLYPLPLFPELSFSFIIYKFSWTHCYIRNVIYVISLWFIIALQSWLFFVNDPYLGRVDITETHAVLLSSLIMQLSVPSFPAEMQFLQQPQSVRRVLWHNAITSIEECEAQA